MSSLALLEQARRAITIERAHAARWVDVVVLASSWAAPRVAAVVVATDVVPETRGWVGAWLHRRAEDVGGGADAFRSEVLEVDADRDTLFVALPEGAELPTPGPASLAPFDFLQAPHRMLTSPDMQGVLPRLAEQLEAMAGEGLALECEGAGHLDPAWRHDHVCVWGPPGTGKTHTLVDQAAALLSDPTERVLLVSNTNRATDEIALRLGALLAGDRRLVGVARLGTVVRPQAYEDAGLLSLLPEASTAQLVAMAAAQQAFERASTAAARAQAREKLAALRAGQPTLATHATDTRLRCVVTTLHAALRAVVADEVRERLVDARPPFTTVVIDEASLVGRLQAGAASMLASRRVVLVGDPCQLSPIAKAARSMPPDVVRWIARSGLDHLLHEAAQPAVCRLQVQRRMHPQIRAAVSALAYDHTLDDLEGLADRAWGEPAQRRAPRAVWYVLDEHTDSPAELHARKGPGGRSRVRPLLEGVLAALVAQTPALREQDVLVVAPYRAQVTLAQQWIEREGLTTWRASTVHAQQGSEADVVIFDTVHASSTTWPAHEWVRLVNVGLSRARHQVWLVASRAEMSQPYLAPLRPHLVARVLRGRGDLRQWDTLSDQAPDPVSLFAPVTAEADEVDEAPPPPEVPRPSADHRLGAQIAARKAMRPVLSNEQARLVHRTLHDAGPRLVRGVAGSGKTLVLAYWVVRALHGLGVPEVVVVHANKALRPLIEGVLAQAWSSLHPVPGPMPWHRVHLVHVGDLLRDLLREAELAMPGDADAYDYEDQARRVLAAGVEPRYAAVFVDEAQDLGHDTLQLVIGLAREGEDGQRAALIFYDNAQNVYGRRAPRWRDLGLDLRGRSDVMKESFRSTRPNIELALDVLGRLRPLEQDPDLRELMTGTAPMLDRDAEGWWKVRFCPIDGQAPQVRVFDDRQHEVDMIVRQVRKWVVEDGVLPGDIRVLALRNTRDALVAGLRAGLRGVARVEHRTSEGFAEVDEAVVVTTPHSFKGYDAELVVVAGVDGYIARGEVLASPLYVAMTRARTLLLVTATRPPDPSTPGAALVHALEQAAARPR